MAVELLANGNPFSRPAGGIDPIQKRCWARALNMQTNSLMRCDAIKGASFVVGLVRNESSPEGSQEDIFGISAATVTQCQNSESILRERISLDNFVR
jgi:hypothetical protein